VENRSKFCQNCGAEIDIRAEICPKCGVATADKSVENIPSGGPSGLAITAFILSILGITCLCSIFGPILSIAAFIIGWLELSKINKGNSSPKGKWMAVFAMIAGGIFALIGIVIVVFWGGMLFLSLLGG
jgi:hypothetical protein